MMDPTKRTLDQTDSPAKKHCVKFGKGCILAMENLTGSVAISVAASWPQLLRIRRYDRSESQRKEEWTRHLDSKYGCVPGLTDAMFTLTWDRCRGPDQIPIMSSTTRKMQDLALRAISVNGIIHQCRGSTMASCTTPSEKGSLYRDNKYTMLRRFVEKIMIDDVKHCRESNDVGVLSVGLQQLHQSLCYMRDGRIDRALESILIHWSFADCLRITEIGMHVFFEERRGHQHGDNAIQVSMAKLSDERIHERYMESELDHVGDMDKVLSTSSAVVQSTNFLPDLPLTYDWLEGFYDPVFVNNWFFWMQEPFRLTDKILVCENEDRRGHLAYVVCYNNSYRTRKIMCKLFQNDSPTTSGRRALDKDNESNRFPHYGSKRHTEVSVNPGLDVVKPQCFIQMDNGPCCTMALFNFVANKGGSPTTTRILEDISGDRSAAEDNMILRSLHHYVLCGGHFSQDDSNQSASLLNDTTMEGNHVVLITHFNGYVWEIDSAKDGGGAYCLGKEGTEWTDVAQKRLEQWTYAAWATQIHNDVHVIVAENSTI